MKLMLFIFPIDSELYVGIMPNKRVIYVISIFKANIFIDPFKIFTRSQ